MFLGEVSEGPVGVRAEEVYVAEEGEAAGRRWEMGFLPLAISPEAAYTDDYKTCEN